MTDLDTWHKTNNEYLFAAVQWLRLRLARLIEQQGDGPSSIQTSSSSSTPAPGSPLSVQRDNASSEPLDLPNPGQRIDEQIEQGAAAMTKGEASDPPPALIILSQRLGLTRFEEQILLLCAAMEFDTRIVGLCAQAQNDRSCGNPTFALALALFDDPAWEALSPDRPLRYWRLIEINQPGAQALTTSALRADERVVNYLKGLNHLDDRLATMLVPVRTEATHLPPSQQEQAQTIILLLRNAIHTLPVVHLLGTDTDSKRAVASHVSRKLHLNLHRLPLDMLPAALPEMETFARLYDRESKLLPLALYLDVHDAEKELPLINRLLSKIGGPVFLDTREPWPQLGRDVLSLDITKPTYVEQENAWKQVLGEEAGNMPALLAGQFNLNLHDINRIANVVDAQKPEVDRVWEACVIASRPRLDTLAQRLELKTQTWDDLVLPEPEKKLLRQIMEQVTQRQVVYQQWGFSRKLNRGLGINALFAGESGTGKTLAAEVIARELKLNLYRIDLSQVVSKYIGETEKNLRKLFDAAEDGGTILFFDEADALFGKRSEVKDSHDRYANIEINYLLQRMEAYHGLAILATNRKSALDTAFMRRLRFIVNFPFPGIPERKRIWERAFPTETVRDSVDYERLARLSLTGGSIQNIAINAAFLAAGAGSPVTMPLILEAARTEFRKLDKPINEAEFRLIQPVEARA